MVSWYVYGTCFYLISVLYGNKAGELGYNGVLSAGVDDVIFTFPLHNLEKQHINCLQAQIPQVMPTSCWVLSTSSEPSVQSLMIARAVSWWSVWTCKSKGGRRVKPRGERDGGGKEGGREGGREKKGHGEGQVGRWKRK